MVNWLISLSGPGLVGDSTAWEDAPCRIGLALVTYEKSSLASFDHSEYGGGA